MDEARLDKLETRVIELIEARASDAAEIRSLTSSVEKLNESVSVLNANMNKGQGIMAAALFALSALSAAVGAFITNYFGR